MIARWAVCLCWAVLLCVPALTGQIPVKSDSILSYTRTVDGVDLQTQHGIVQIRFCTDAVVHVVFQPPRADEHAKPWIAKTSWPAVDFSFKEDPNHLVILSTKQLGVTVERDSSAVVFQDAQGRVLIRESASPAPRDLTAINVDRERVSQPAPISISPRTRLFTDWASTRVDC